MERITFRTGEGKEYHLEVDHINPNILSAGSPGRVRKIADFMDDTEVQEGSRGMTVVHGEYEGIPVSAFPTGMGPASAAIVLPEAIEAAEGPVTLLRLGTAGSLQPHMGVGDMAVSVGAIRDEGTTTAAVGLEFPSFANPELVPVLIAAARKHGYELGENLWTGINHVKDDLYFKETPRFSPSRERMEPRLKSYERMGALASEMEFSVYTILRDFYEGRREGNIQVGAFLAIITEPEEDESVEVDKKTKKRLEKDMIKSGLDALKLTDDLRKGKEIEEDFGQIISSMIGAPSRFELQK